MNKREKILVIVIGVLAVAMLGRMAKTRYVGKLATQRKQKADLDQKLLNTRFEVAQAEKGAARWKELGTQTLSMDSNEAMSRLRDSLFELVKDCRLGKEQVTLGQVSSLKTGVRVLSCTVSGEGTMDKLVQFLFKLYREPYLVRCRSLDVQQVGGRAPRGQLKFTVKLETPILPRNEKVARIEPVTTRPHNEVPRTLLARLSDYDVITSKKMWEPYVEPLPGKASEPKPTSGTRDVELTVTLTWMPGANARTHQVYFGTTSPGQAQPAQPASTLTRGGLQPGTTYYWRVDEIGEGGTRQGDAWSFMTKGSPPAVAIVPSQPPPPVEPPDGKMILSRVISAPRVQQAVLEEPGAAGVAPPPPPPSTPPGGVRAGAAGNAALNTAAAAAAAAAAANTPDKRVEVGEPMFGGILVLVHPKGAVTQRDGVFRFHAIGVALKDAQVLDEQSQPEVFHELRKLQARVAGISEGPG